MAICLCPVVLKRIAYNVTLFLVPAKFPCIANSNQSENK